MLTSISASMSISVWGMQERLGGPSKAPREGNGGGGGRTGLPPGLSRKDCIQEGTVGTGSDSSCSRPGRSVLGTVRMRFLGAPGLPGNGGVRSRLCHRALTRPLPPSAHSWTVRDNDRSGNRKRQRRGCRSMAARVQRPSAEALQAGPRQLALSCRVEMHVE